MTSTTTTTTAESNETIRLAAAYDDKSHEGVSQGLATTLTRQYPETSI